MCSEIVSHCCTGLAQFKNRVLHIGMNGNVLIHDLVPVVMFGDKFIDALFVGVIVFLRFCLRGFYGFALLAFQQTAIRAPCEKRVLVFFV